MNDIKHESKKEVIHFGRKVIVNCNKKQGLYHYFNELALAELEDLAVKRNVNTTWQGYNNIPIRKTLLILALKDSYIH